MVDKHTVLSNYKFTHLKTDYKQINGSLKKNSINDNVYTKG